MAQKYAIMTLETGQTFDDMEYMASGEMSQISGVLLRPSEILTSWSPWACACRGGPSACWGFFVAAKHQSSPFLIESNYGDAAARSLNITLVNPALIELRLPIGR